MLQGGIVNLGIWCTNSSQHQYHGCLMFKLRGQQTCMCKACYKRCTVASVPRFTDTRLYGQLYLSRQKAHTERFSNECRETKTKVITLANHSRRKQCNESIRIQSKCVQLAPSAGKRVRARHDCFWFGFSLVEKVARVLSTNHRA